MDELILPLPDLKLVQYAFNKQVDLAVEEIKKYKMKPYYEFLQKSQKLPKLQGLDADPLEHPALEEDDDYAKMQQTVKSAVYLAQQGSLDAIPIFEQVISQSGNAGLKIEALLACVRLHWLYNKDPAPLFAKLDTLVENADWDRRNKYKVYKAVYLLTKRQFTESSVLLAETLSTFTSYELCTFQEYTQIAVIVCILTHSRPDLKKLNIQVDSPLFVEYQQSLYLCNYGDFFLKLSDIEEYMEKHWFLSLHLKYYIKEMKLKAYQQVLTSYQSIHIHHLARLFGVSNDYIES
eukprot:NODE_208_length_12861_cov_0.800972.p6 type:complete len:292 gc:universal NODE_208_length_12861_cov_0.800972:3332-4207(+)